MLQINDRTVRFNGVACLKRSRQLHGQFQGQALRIEVHFFTRSPVRVWEIEMFSRVKPNNFLIPSLDLLIFKYAALSLFRGPCFTCLTLSPQISVIIAPNVIFEKEVNNLLVHVLSKR